MLIVSTGLLGAVGIFMFLWGTATYGIGIRSDSIAYLWSAKHLHGGIDLGIVDAFGKFMPLNHKPPFFPVLLAPFEVLKIDPIVEVQEVWGEHAIRSMENEIRIG